MLKVSEALIRQRFESLRPLLDERTRRLWAAAEARAIGVGGIAAVERATGLSRTTIRAGARELSLGVAQDLSRVRRPGGGRRALETRAPEVLGALDQLIEPFAERQSRFPLRWTTKSVRRLREELAAMGYSISEEKVRKMLSDSGYQFLRHGADCSAVMDRRDAQLASISRRVERCVARGVPVVWLDASRAHGRGPSRTRSRTQSRGMVEQFKQWWHANGQGRRDATEVFVVSVGWVNSPAERNDWLHTLAAMAKAYDIVIAAAHVPAVTLRWKAPEVRPENQNAALSAIVESEPHQEFWFQYWNCLVTPQQSVDALLDETRVEELAS